jgi:hypothetical protein
MSLLYIPFCAIDLARLWTIHQAIMETELYRMVKLFSYVILLFLSHTGGD